jgi:PAS domain S-box-containing protein
MGGKGMKPDFNSLLANESPDAMVITTPGGTVVYWNSRAQAVFGYGSPEAVGRSLNKLIDPLDQPAQEREDPRQTSETEIVTIEAVRQRNDGSLVYVDISSKAIRNAEGEIEFCLSSIKDVTHLRVLRDAKFVHSKFGSLLESAPDGIVMVNATGRIVFTNSQADKLLGYERKELRGKLVEELLSERFRDAQVDHPGYRAAFFAEPRARAMGADLELYALRKDGSEFPVEISLNPFETEAGILVSGTIRDITERKRAEEVLRQSEERFRLLVEGVQEYAIFMLNPQGNVISWNKGAERIKGYKVDEIIGKHFSCFYTPEAIAQGKPQQELRTAMEHGQMSEEGWRVRKDGHKFWTSVVITALFDKDGCLQGFAKISRDMTEAKQIEQALNDKNIKLQENAQELARSNRDLQQFAYVASHDLQEPLRMVASFTQLLAKRYQDKLDQDAQDFIKFAVDGATRMQALISDLLAYSRVDRQEKPLKLTNCDAILEQVLVNLKLAIFDSGAVITHDPLPRMMADAAQLGQLFQNLLGNAIKFRSEKPTRVHFSSQRDGNGWKISVQDNGIGISSEYRERVFLIFQRLHTTAEYPGTGIGLAICKKIVERHGGRIWIESPPEGGSIFSFTLLTPLVT